MTRTTELGPDDRSREELVAEFTSSYLCAEAGIGPATIENQAAYIESWRRALKDDPRALIVAAGAAQRAADYILDRQPADAAQGRTVERDREREQEADAQHRGTGREAIDAPEPDLDEQRGLAEAGRGPEEPR